MRNLRTTDETVELKLTEAVTHILEECRMVLPGVQALFGFQLVAVFNAAFHEKLTHVEQLIHIGAVGAVAMGVVLIMTPAAYHRQSHPRQDCESFIELASLLLLWTMPLIAIGIGLDFYLLTRLAKIPQEIGIGITTALMIWTFLFWFTLPKMSIIQKIMSAKAERSKLEEKTANV